MTSVQSLRGVAFERSGSVYVESCKIVFLGALPIHLFRHFCCTMCCLATRGGRTNAQTDRQTHDSIMPIAFSKIGNNNNDKDSDRCYVLI